MVKIQKIPNEAINSSTYFLHKFDKNSMEKMPESLTKEKRLISTLLIDHTLCELK
jgi:hypothetical protein